MDKLKFGIVGFGFMGHCHEDMLNTMDNAEVVAICDIVPEQMEDSITPNVQKFTNVDDLLKIEEIDTIIVVTPNITHLEIVSKAAKAGKNILCEKPVALTVGELDEMLKVVEENNVRFTVHQQRRFDKDFRTMKEVYDSRELGEVYTIQSKLYGFNGNMHDWHVYKELGGGMLYDWGVHLIDQMLQIVDGKITQVYADVRNVINKEVDDYFKIILRYDTGVVCEIELGTYFLSDKERWFERHWFVGGNKGSAYSDGFDPQGKIVSTTRLLENVDKKVTMTHSGPTRSFGPPQDGTLVTKELPKVDVYHKMFFEEYIECIQENKELFVKPEEVRRVLMLMDLARLSAATGKSVDFE